MKKKLTIREDFFEEKAHGDYCFPFEISHDTLSAFEHGFLECHWHPELEFSVVLSGSMEYQVNGVSYRLTQGCGIFVNANNLHTAKAYDGQDCNYFGIIFNPVLVFGHENSSIQRNYVDIIVRAENFPALYLDPASDSHNRIMKFLLDINAIYQGREICYELLIKGKLCELWSILFKEFCSDVRNKNASSVRDIPRIKQMLNHIHSHYNHKLTLQNIASSCNLSKGECCRYFKRIIRQTPFEYLLNYRIQKSLALLIERQLNITEIAERVGFPNSSYYSEIFRRYMNCSPKEYRNLHRSE